MTLGSHLKCSIVIEHATEIAQTTTVCSLINGGPFPVSHFFATEHDVSGFEATNKRRRVMCCEERGGEVVVGGWGELGSEQKPVCNKAFINRASLEKYSGCFWWIFFLCL